MKKRLQSHPLAMTSGETIHPGLRMKPFRDQSDILVDRVSAKFYTITSIRGSDRSTGKAVRFRHSPAAVSGYEDDRQLARFAGCKATRNIPRKASSEV